MKKILISTFAAGLLLLSASCSNDDDFTSNEKTGKLYPVKFNVSAMNVDAQPLAQSSGVKGVEDNVPVVLQYMIYDKDENLVKTESITTREITTPQLTFDFNIETELEEGEYRIATILTPLMSGGESMHPGAVPHTEITAEANVISPVNYNTDICHIGVYTTGVLPYYNTQKFTVARDLTDQSIDMELDPMWSRVFIKITDANDFYLPENAKKMYIEFINLTQGFKLSDGKGLPYDREVKIIAGIHGDIRNMPGFSTNSGYLNQTGFQTSQCNSSAIKFTAVDDQGNFIKSVTTEARAWDVGNNYVVNITFGNSFLDGINSDVTVTCKELSDKDVDLEIAE